MSHIFANKIRLDSNDYVVEFVLWEDDNGNRFYDHELTEIINPDWLKPEPALPKGNVVHRTNRGDVMNLLRDKLGVNDGTGRILFQSAFHNEQSSLTLKQGTKTGRLFQGREYQTPDEAFVSGTAAMEKVITKQTDVLDAMFRPGVGSISFYWGTPGKGAKFKGGSGVSHLIAPRKAEGQDGEESARKMVRVLAYGEIGPEYGPQDGQHRNVAYDGHTAVLSLYRFGNRETWLLTGWKDNPVGENGAVNAPNPTQIHSSGIRSELGATGPSESNIRPLGADGKTLFHSRGGSPRASITPVDDRYLIQLYEKADLSSFLHEIGHFFLLEMEQDIQNGIADKSTKSDYATLRHWLGAQEGIPLSRDQQEKFARGFELYLHEGKAPSRELESVFARFKKWLTQIYKQATQLNVEMTDEVRGVFDRLLASDAELTASAANKRVDAGTAAQVRPARAAPAKVQAKARLEKANQAGQSNATIWQRELDAAIAPIAKELSTTMSKEAVDANMALLRHRAEVASSLWREAGEDITPAQWIMQKVGLRVETGKGGITGVDGQREGLLHAAILNGGDPRIEWRNGTHTIK